MTGMMMQPESSILGLLEIVSEGTIAERGDCFFGPESTAGSSEKPTVSQSNSFLRFNGEARIVGEVLELAGSKVRRR